MRFIHLAAAVMGLSLASVACTAQQFRPPQVPGNPAPAASDRTAQVEIPLQEPLGEGILPGPQESASPAVTPLDAFGLTPIQPRDNRQWSAGDPTAEEPPVDEQTLSMIRSGKIPLDVEPVRPGAIEEVKTRYPDGSVQILKHVAQDEEGNYFNHGVWRLFNPQGQVLAEGQFNDGQMEGQWQRWHPANSSPLFQSPPFTSFTGPFLSTATFVDGQLDGVWIIQDRDKRKIVEIPYRKGKRDGTATWYYPNGQRMRIANFRDGLLDGPLTEWDESGKVVRNEQYVEGKKVIRNTSFYRPQQKESEAYFLDAKLELESQDDWWDAAPAAFVSRGSRIQHGPVTAWYDNGQVKMKGQYLNDLRVGRFTWWHPNGQRALVGQYEDGKKSGRWTWWHPNGMKAIEGQYENDQPIGSWTWWNEEGRVTATQEFSPDESIGVLVEPGASDSEMPRNPNDESNVDPLPPPDAGFESMEEIDPLEEPGGQPEGDGQSGGTAADTVPTLDGDEYEPLGNPLPEQGPSLEPPKKDE